MGVTVMVVVDGPAEVHGTKDGKESYLSVPAAGAVAVPLTLACAAVILIASTTGTELDSELGVSGGKSKDGLSVLYSLNSAGSRHV
jgi:hypothetical protein